MLNVRSYKCSIDTCDRQGYSRGWCKKHYNTYIIHGDLSYRDLSRAVQGTAPDFIQKALSYRGDDCLFWPYAKDSHGRGSLRVDGHTKQVHQIICEKVHGIRPTQSHEVAHSCGNGHLACSTPSHLRWATKKENGADTRRHGRHRGENHTKAKLTERQVIEMIARVRNGETQASIAREYGINPSVVSNIYAGRSWSYLRGDTNV